MFGPTARNFLPTVARSVGCVGAASSSSTVTQSTSVAAFQQGQRRMFAYDAQNPTHNKIKEIVDKNEVTLFMKGNPIFPQCGFSRTVCEVLKREGLEGQFHSVNVLEDQEVREGVKDFSDWPTIPQLYVKGQFVGGCDIVLGMHRDGELKQELEGVVKKE